MDINFLAVLVGVVLSMVLGTIWYGPLFGKKWMALNGMDLTDPEEIARARRGMWKVYVAQILLSLFQVYVLAHFIQGWSDVSAVEVSLWVWGAFVMPTVAGAVMWSNLAGAWSRFLIQSGYQLVLFVLLGFLLGAWQ